MRKVKRNIRAWRKYRNYFCVFSAVKLLKRLMNLNMIYRILFLAGLLLPLAAFTQTTNGYRMKTIVIDAGHGGHDTGCRGAHSNEKEVTLAIALRIGELLNQRYPEVKVVYTRKTDVFVELFERANIANRHNADLFISIHCNASKSTTAYGTETWLMGLHKSEGNLEVSKRENNVILMEDDYQQNYDGFDPNSPEGYIILTMNQNVNMEQSIHLASMVEEEFRRQGRTSRGVKQAGFLVLWRTTMPAILVETGFLTNREEEKYLASEKGQLEVSEAVLAAIAAYKAGVEEGEVNPIAGSNEKAVGKNSSVGVAAEEPNKPTAVLAPQQKGSDSARAELFYSIQIAASARQLNLKESKYASLQGIRNDKSAEGMNRYVVGQYLSYDECLNQLAAIRKKGFKDAFIVAYEKGQRRPVHPTP
jgi:N-acetylmuramoyl-L-alanine amidase